MFTVTVPDLQACLNVAAATPKGWLGGCARERTGPRYAYRLALCESQFTAALVETLLDRDVFEHLEVLRTVLALHPDILAYVLTGNSEVEWREFSPAFAVVNAPTTLKEAA
ncbi:hypothetical protein [Thalassovita sp.]|uniref:hypothetical protein n=1 Tax=Thalassovita sp. TaxID=1979401 RepID=UPI002882B2DE|nr:hypothetical protein [Thalassovita sp.]MDF1802008.1 hypothetical protein [Thalassovita sp.]